MEQVIAVSVEVGVLTNKGDSVELFNNYFDATKHLFAELTDEQRQEIYADYCSGCGTPTTDKECYCMRDD
jgi:hypothetical protein